MLQFYNSYYVSVYYSVLYKYMSNAFCVLSLCGLNKWNLSKETCLLKTHEL